MKGFGAFSLLLTSLLVDYVVLAQNKIDLYYTDVSPPCRTVLLTAKAIGLQMNMKEIDLQKKDQLKPEFLKLNPQHTVPTIVDQGYPIWDSHAIAAYLVTAYGKDDSLYPKDPKKRATVDQRLHFDSSILYPRISAVFVELLVQKKKMSAENQARLNEAFEFLEGFLKEKQWIAGDQMTIADFSAVSSVSTLEVLGSGISQYPNLSAWLQRCKESMTGYDEANQKGLDKFAALLKQARSK